MLRTAITDVQGATYKVILNVNNEESINWSDNLKRSEIQLIKYFT